MLPLKDLAILFHTQAQHVMLQGKYLTDIRDKRGANTGNTSRIYFAAKMFFEKLSSFYQSGRPDIYRVFCSR